MTSGTRPSVPPLARKSLITFAAIVGLVFSTTTPANAYAPNAHVYAVARQADGWACPGWANKQAHVAYANHTTGRNGGDGGDDVVYVPVRTGVNNSVTISVRCTFGTYMSMNYSIRPTRHNQTFFFNLNGSYRSN